MDRAEGLGVVPIRLRDDQLALVDRVRDSYRRGSRSVIMQLPTGGGKTAVASVLIQQSTAKGKRVLFLAHLDAILDDTSERLNRAGVAHGIVQAGYQRTNAPVQVGSLATLHVRGETPEADLIILDECQHAMSDSVRAILERYPHAHILGLTATPQRGDGQGLGDVFQEIVRGPTAKELIAIGAVVPCEMYAPVHPTDPKTLAMDVSLARTMYGARKRTIVFADSVGHARGLVENEFTGRASLVIGSTSREDRRIARAKLASGERPILVGYGVFLEGWDSPEVELLLLARPFSVTASFLQAIGRGVRSSPGKTKCIAVDLCGSVLLHGLFEDERKWSLEGAAVARLAVPRLSRCAVCYAVFTPQAVCPRCGATARKVKQVKLPRTRAEHLEDLSKLSPEERDERYMETLKRTARKRFGEQNEDRVSWWARRTFEQRFHRAPLRRQQP